MINFFYWIIFLICTYITFLFNVENFIDYTRKLLYRYVPENCKKIILHNDNGNRVELDIDLKAWNSIKSLKKIECSDKNLKTCLLANNNSDCFECEQILAECVSFEEDKFIYDNDGNLKGSLKKNLPGEGYCLRIEKKNNRTCSSKHGGHWLLSRLEHGKFAFICFCSYPSFFSNHTIHSDCLQFNGCLHGEIENPESWNELSDIKCKCYENYKEIKEGIYSKCVKKNAFHFDDNNQLTLEKKFIEPSYSGASLTLYNPCIFDAINRKFEINAGIVKLDEKLNIAYCESIDPQFVTLQFEDDYLIGNAGKFANGIGKISNKIQNPDVRMFETHTRRRDGTYYGHLNGRRYNEKDLTIFLPYLDLNSANRGGDGNSYNTFQNLDGIKKNQIIYVYVYNASIPTPVNMPTSENFINFIPTIVSNFEATNRYFSGNLPYFKAPIDDCSVQTIIRVYKLLFGTKYPEYNDYGDGIALGNIDFEKDKQFMKRYVRPILCKDSVSNNIVVNPHTKIFTGIFMIENKKNEIVISVVSPGKFLAIQYRNKIPNWTSSIIKSTRIYHKPLRVESGNRGAGVTSFGFDCDEVANPPRVYSHYNCSNDKFSWPKTYWKPQ